MIPYLTLSYIITGGLALFVMYNVEYLHTDDRTMIGMVVVLAPLILPILALIFISYWVGRILALIRKS